MRRTTCVAAGLLLLAGVLPATASDAPPSRGAATGQSGTSAGDATGATDPALAFMSRHQGVWRGTFRRYDADGKLTQELPSLIVSRVIRESGRTRFHQTNRLRRADGTEETIDSEGDIRDGRVWFENPRAQGWARPVDGDATGRMGVLTLTFRDGGLYMHEIVSLSDDGRFRSRVAQYLKDGRLVRRTQIDEQKVTDDWAGYDPQRDRP